MTCIVKEYFASCVLFYDTLCTLVTFFPRLPLLIEPIPYSNIQISLQVATIGSPFTRAIRIHFDQGNAGKSH
jgi:hypothetical protein